jgi:hypothetical protein
MNIVRSILAIIFSLLVFISSTSFIVGIHRCGGQVQNMALLTKAEKCAMEEQMPPCHRHLQKPCCEDETVVHEGQGFKHTLSQYHIGHAPSVDIEFPLVLISEIIPTAPIARTLFHFYDPPLRSTDRIVSLQVFLI